MRKFLSLILLIKACNSKDQKSDSAYTLGAAKYGNSTLSKEGITRHKTLKVFKTDIGFLRHILLRTLCMQVFNIVKS